jgi:putative membrane protein
VPGIAISGIVTALIAGACLGFINMIIKPILTLVTLPINLLTLGLFSIILNGLLFWALTAIVPGFIITTFTAALIGAFIVACINWIGSKILRLD